METGPCSWIVRVRTAVAVCCGLPESVTVTVISEEVAEVGVPLMTPLEGLSDNPKGSLPELTDHV